jgi:hypothetical protein
VFAHDGQIYCKTIFGLLVLDRKRQSIPDLHRNDLSDIVYFRIHHYLQELEISEVFQYGKDGWHCIRHSRQGILGQKKGPEIERKAWVGQGRNGHQLNGFRTLVDAKEISIMSSQVAVRQKSCF